VTLVVVSAGPATTVQDLGRAGYAHLGVSPAGAADPRSLARANILVGNAAGTPAFEAALRGPALTCDRPVTIAVSGARCRAGEGPHRLEPGAVFDVGPLRGGLRAYIAVAGGLAVAPVLGSASTDIRCLLGPPPVRDGDRFDLGGAAPAAAPAPEPVPLDRPVWLPVRPGPRPDRCPPAAWAALLDRDWAVGLAASRTGFRLAGPALPASEQGWPSEGVIAGAVQLPPDGQPIVLLCEHPTTGGYPVVAVVTADGLPVAGQLRPGDAVRFRSSGGTGR
jgi:biotin-dependent carboxylase-like uncharacterized protein